MTETGKHTATHCHCGAERITSDHCDFCGCEEFEGTCDLHFEEDADGTDAGQAPADGSGRPQLHLLRSGPGGDEEAVAAIRAQGGDGEVAT